MPEQLPFLFPFTPHFTAAEFLADESNRLARQYLAATATWPGGRLVLWGPAGAGKTHLLHIWAAANHATMLRAGTLHEPAWPQGALAIDNLDQAPSPEALLHHLNAAAEAGHPVLMAARQPPARMDIQLPDLASRLRAATAVEIGLGDDAFLAGLLTRLAAARQVSLTSAAQAWLLARLPRTAAAMRDAAARLDQAAQGAQTGLITRALAAQAMAGLLHDDLLTAEPDPSPPQPSFGTMAG